jgi:hypothetical protein
MSSKTIRLANIPPGTYLSWFSTTQTEFKIRMVLRDDRKVYFDETRQSRQIMPPMAQGSAWYEGKGLEVFVDIPQARQEHLREFINTSTLLTPLGDEVGYSFTCCGEDQTDNDYKDFYLNVMSWTSKG